MMPSENIVDKEAFWKEAGITEEQFYNEGKLLEKNKKIVPQQKYVFGKPLVSQREFKALPTKMRQFHEWYMKVSFEGTVTFPARVKGDYYSTMITGFGQTSKIYLMFTTKTLWT